ncbi:MAG: PIN domain-containing protein [Pseudomonadota bacterium]
MEVEPNSLIPSIYIDTNICIYFIELNEAFSRKTTHIIKQLYARKTHIITSELTLAECLVKPIKEKNIELASLYTEFLQNREGFTVTPVSKAILLESARIKSETKGALPDAIHLATARLSGCRHILSNDRMKIPSDLELITVDA